MHVLRIRILLACILNALHPSFSLLCCNIAGIKWEPSSIGILCDLLRENTPITDLE